MGQCESTALDILGLLRGVSAGVAAENDDIQQTVTHQTIAAVDAAYDLTGGVQILHIGLAVIGDLKSAVLVMECGVDQDRLLANVDAVLAEHTHHGGDPLFDGAGTVL